ncbi:thioesterase family protein [Acinetobacter sp. ANC 3791]|uniref:thioesterase family protein n=1 Tax=Acinetobacter sp. ANC 3791 TaxID=2529836 RepID=UPI001040DA48|nr:thioesterase family protein [Acinetobacter sp. ANC 3791]TCB84179.1 thioesterase family protein [Acinetobacter sp. ANC 3791]
MGQAKKTWTGQLDISSENQLSAVLQQLCDAFNHSPFLQHNGICMRVVNDQIQGHLNMQPNLIGNVAYEILHGGVAATLLDSLGGVVAMAELYKRADIQHREQVLKQIERLATLDLRVDYLAPGRGQAFIAHAEVLRMGKKSCTMRMSMQNDCSVTIAVAIASYAY